MKHMNRDLYMSLEETRKMAEAEKAKLVSSIV